MASTLYKSNPQLKTILAEWKGNPMINGRYIDPHKRFGSTFMKFLRWQFSKKEKKEEKRNDTWRLRVRKGNDFLRSTDNCIVWLGHATFYMQLNGVRMITDPVFGRISGVVPRYSELPCSPSDFRNIDYVLLSHAHRDHCDSASLKKLAAQNRFQLLTSLSTGSVVAEWLNDLHFQEAGWYQQYNLPNENLRITFLPTQHWSNRYGWDTNRFLWGSFMIEADGLNIYFGGDSGYCSYPKQIATLFPNIDIAIIGVGAYTPAFMMQEVHTSPWEAVDVFHNLRAKTFIPMHYGTFDLADEPLGEPYRALKQMEAEGKINGALRLVDVGEVIKV
ncbi:MAG: MBL fold metallo-hydrolase [Chitinophagales bacterium]|nr:MBL fold metallo-hydrolase [Chitinophagales bacterium]